MLCYVLELPNAKPKCGKLICQWYIKENVVLWSLAIPHNQHATLKDRRMQQVVVYATNNALLTDKMVSILPWHMKVINVSFHGLVHMQICFQENVAIQKNVMTAIVRCVTRLEERTIRDAILTTRHVSITELTSNHSQ